MDKILSLFLENPNAKLHIREVAKKLKISPTTARKFLIKLEKEGMLTKQREGIYHYFKANIQSDLFRIKAKCYMLEKITKSGLIDFISNTLIPEVIILFGSIAKGEYSTKSDIDLFIVSESNKKINLDKFEKKLKRKIQLFVYSHKKLVELKRKRKEFLNNVINGITIKGNLEVP
ncbi:MAG: nucleotidyltransferase domain-containing protein [Nanoarchaeota archaeon]|nr:nucleotidyltransferase domain-containing protein [Nanoarchaeota archaeon]